MRDFTAANTEINCPSIMMFVANRESFNKKKQSQSGHFQLNVVFTKR